MNQEEYPNLSPQKLKNETVFSHSKTYYDNGSLRSERFYTDDSIMVKEIIYSPAGQIREINNYKKNGTISSSQRFTEEFHKSGLALTYYEDGQLQSQKYFVNGKVHWEEKIYGPNGHLIEVINYHRGGKNGKHTIYNENGAKLFEMDYKNGLPHGLTRIYYENGQLKAEMGFNNGSRHGISKVFYQNGVLKIEESMRDDLRDGYTNTFYENGGKKESWSYCEGKVEGSCSFFYKNGELYGVKNFKEGKEEGTAKLFYENGNIKEEVNYASGKKSGIGKYYDEQGRLQREVIYSDDEVIKEVEKKPEETYGQLTTKQKIIRNVNYALIFLGVLSLLYVVYFILIAYA